MQMVGGERYWNFFLNIFLTDLVEETENETNLDKLWNRKLVNGFKTWELGIGLWNPEKLTGNLSDS